MEEISRYMRYKLATTPAHGDIGAYAHKLPKARGTDPAQEVLVWEARQSNPSSAPLVAHQALSTKRKAPPPPPVAPVADPEEEPEALFPAEGYQVCLDETSGSWFLMLPETGDEVPLPEPEDEAYVMYKDDETG